MDIEFSETLGIAGVAFIGLIVSGIQVAKRFFPDAHDNVWLGISLLSGLILQVLFVFAFVGTPDGLGEWFTVFILGFAFALSASKAYDTAKARRNGG